MSDEEPRVTLRFIEKGELTFCRAKLIFEQGQPFAVADEGDGLHRNNTELDAVVILGSDVFDKLLILRALRPDLPDTLFLTTDFDEAFTTESELPWTRNLIISSSFGPNLSDELQGALIPFRDSYQTSAFLATQLAIGDPKNKFSSYLVANGLSVPRIFEIERSGYAQFFAKPKFFAKAKNSLLIADLPPERLQPEIEKLFPTYEAANRKPLATRLVAGALFLLAMLFFRKVPYHVRIEAWLIFVGLAVGTLAHAFWEQFAVWLTENGNGEPINIIQGGLWATVSIRILSVIVAFYFIWRAQVDLHSNLVAIAEVVRIWAQSRTTIGTSEFLGEKSRASPRPSCAKSVRFLRLTSNLRRRSSSRTGFMSM